MTAMSKKEFINRYKQDMANKRKEKNKMLASYFYKSGRRNKPWGISGVIQ